MTSLSLVTAAFVVFIVAVLVGLSIQAQVVSALTELLPW